MPDGAANGVSQKRPTILEQGRALWLVALLSALLFGLTNLPWTLDDYDQAKQAFTSFEMVSEGHWFYQHTPNEKIATKPPLVGWISAALYGMTRSWELSWRLPSAAAAVLLLIAVTKTATHAYGTTAGLVALSACALNLLSPRLATLVRTDMPLALVVFLLGAKVFAKVRSAEPWSTRDRLTMFGLLTAAMLIKGPIVYAFLLPGIVAYQWWRRSEGKGGNAWCGWWPWVASLLVFLAWVVGGIAWVPGFYEQVVLREFAGRFSETVHRPQPIYFYLPHLLHKFAPWSILGGALGVLIWKSRRKMSPEIAWLLGWSFGGLLVMSLIPSKRVDRIFPVVSPLCLLLAAGVSSLSKDSALGPRVLRWSVAALLAACLFSSGYAAQRVFLSYRADDAALVRFGAAMRREGVTHGWRYEVIGGKEEGLLLYLRRTRFIKADEAAERWESGTLDALVAPVEEVPQLLAALPGSTLGKLEGSVMIDAQVRRYVLLQRAKL
ncbi:MAG: glycosyltransferase family 39 protein [Chthoniobacterales bacterium]|nr:glycosyltransferase family 39 protein [Chthoniobacterales bacterium]